MKQSVAMKKKEKAVMKPEPERKKAKRAKMAA